MSPIVDALTRLHLALGDRYTIERELGRGGMAIVYLAHDLRHNRRVALKVLFPEFAASLGAERFTREIGIAAVLTHPHIVPLYDSGNADGLPFYVMPFIEGETLGQRLEREPPIPVDEALRIAREVADALEYAHGHGIVHRDIKPDNIMLAGGHAMVADFGIARAIDAAGVGRLTSTGLSIGTPHYMSPEQTFSEDVIDGRSDVYALGCVAYEMLAGRPPFGGETARAIAIRHSRDPVPTLTRPDLPPSIRLAIERALAKDPAERWATAAEFAAALAGLESSAPRPRVPAARRAISKGVLATGTIALALIAGAVALRSRSTPRPTTDPNLVAVLPFRVVGDSSFHYLREGMVDLLSTKFGAMEGLHTVDVRAVLSAWRRMERPGAEPSPEDARALARSLGSGRFVLGDIVATPAGLALRARLLNSDGASQADAAVEGLPDSLFALVDKLSVQLLASSAGEPGQRVADLASASIPAVRAYLVGRAASRRGENARAIRAFSAALEIDSTFALAALGMASSGAWSQQAGQSQALRRGLRTGYALRTRLSRRDQLLFEAWVHPSEPAAHTAARQLAGWLRAAEAAPESPEAQYEYGDRLYHSGAQLGVTDWVERATALFARALALDSAQAQPSAHLVELAARAGDRDLTRQLRDLYTRDAAAADAGDYVQWRAAIALEDQAALTRLGSRRTDIGLSALLRIVGFGQSDGVGLDDVGIYALELRRRVAMGARSGTMFHPAQTLHSWAMNRGHSADQRDALTIVRAAEPIAPGFSIVYFDADQIPVLDALFWDGDSALAAQAVASLDKRVAAPAPRESGARAHHFTDLCVTLLWRQMRTGGQGIGSRLETLRSGAVAGDSSGISGGNPALCVAMLDAIGAVRAKDPLADVAVALLDTLMAAGPFQFGVDFGNLVVARLHEERGAIASALRAIRRRPYDWDTAPLYLTTFLREEGRLAALAGDQAGAARAYRRFLALRAGSDPAFRGTFDSVKAALAALDRAGAKRQ